MKRMHLQGSIIGALMMTGSILVVTTALSAAEKSGESMFKEHCAMCHPDGGNIINPKMTLHKKDREANKVATVQDIVRIMRNPGPGMNKFDQKTLPDKEAKEIAEYIIKTFTK